MKKRGICLFGETTTSSASKHAFKAGCYLIGHGNGHDYGHGDGDGYGNFTWKLGLRSQRTQVFFSFGTPPALSSLQLTTEQRAF